MLKIPASFHCTNVDTYTESGTAWKKCFHREGKLFLRHLVKILQLTKDQYDIRSNVAGIAVSGEITLHTDRLYVQIFATIDGLSVLYRTCQGRRDYVGGKNQFINLERLVNSRTLKNWITELMRYQNVSANFDRLAA